MEKSNYWMHKLCLALLVIQVVWVSAHMFFHYQGKLNPWKLGGYAMYTHPVPFYYATIDMAKMDGDIIKPENPLLSHLNLYATGGCLSGISKRFYKKILFIRPNLVSGEGFVRLSFFEQNYSLSDKLNSNEIIGQAMLTIDKGATIVIEEEFCGKKRKFSINGK